MGVCNIGYRPTVNSDRTDVTVETWLLDYTGDLYGKEIAVHLYQKLRDERKFADLPSLRAQVMQDGEDVRQYFAKAGGCHEP